MNKDNKMKQIKCKLRSFVALNDEDKLFIQTLSHEEKNELLTLYNELLKYIVHYIDMTLK